MIRVFQFRKIEFLHFEERFRYARHAMGVLISQSPDGVSWMTVALVTLESGKREV